MAVLFTIAIVATLAGPAPATASKCDTRCWYVKYHKEKRKAKRLKQSNKALNKVLKKQDQLVKQTVPWINLGPGCEVKGLRHPWRANTGNGFYGGPQFTLSTWRAYGGHTFSKKPNRATPIQQVAIAQKVLAGQGRGAWPHCGKYL